MTAMFQGSAVVACRAPAVTHRSCLELAVMPSAVRSARHWAANLLIQEHYHQDLIDTLVLLVSELVTNAIHAVSELASPAAASATAKATGRHRVWLAIERSCAFVRIEVHDTACVPVPAQARRSDSEEESGRGLDVVAALASYWGWNPDSFGKVVWCEVALKRPG